MEMGVYAINELKSIAKYDANNANATIMTMFGVTVFVMIISILIGVYISVLITKPLKRVLHMIEEMNKGHLGVRLNINNDDEVGQIAKAMDYFADELQTKVIGTMNKISEGNVTMNITASDENDEMSPVLKKTVETIRGLNDEVQRLIKATTEGKLDTRGNTDLYVRYLEKT